MYGCWSINFIEFLACILASFAVNLRIDGPKFKMSFRVQSLFPAVALPWSGRSVFVSLWLDSIALAQIRTAKLDYISILGVQLSIFDI